MWLMKLTLSGKFTISGFIVVSSQSLPYQTSSPPNVASVVQGMLRVYRRELGFSRDAVWGLDGPEVYQLLRSLRISNPSSVLVKKPVSRAAQLPSIEYHLLPRKRRLHALSLSGSPRCLPTTRQSSVADAGDQKEAGDCG